MIPTMSKETIEVLDPEMFPVLSNWQKNNPNYLLKVLASMQKKQGGTLEQMAISLESDLQTDES